MSEDGCGCVASLALIVLAFFGGCHWGDKMATRYEREKWCTRTLADSSMSARDSLRYHREMHCALTEVR